MLWQFGFFDWNGTLLDDLEIAYESVKEIFRRFKLQSPTLQEYRTKISSDFSGFYYQNGIPRETTPEELNLIRKEFLETYWCDAKLHDGALGLLQTCAASGLKIGLVSAEVPEILAARLQQFGIKDLFFHAEGGAWPKKDALKRLGEKLELRNGTWAFYVDDTPEGIQAASEAGFTTVGFANGYALPSAIRRARPNFIAHSLSEIARIVQSAQ